MSRYRDDDSFVDDSTDTDSTSDSGEDESIIVPRSRSRKNRPAIESESETEGDDDDDDEYDDDDDDEYDDDDDDEYDDEDAGETEIEQRALSPRTRMSITGVRPEDLSDDSSEIDYEKAPKRLSNVSEDFEEEDSSINSFIEDSIVNSSTIERSSTSGKRGKVASIPINVQGPSPTKTRERSPRYTANFAPNITDKLSSTVYLSPSAHKSLSVSSDGSDIQILSNKERTIEIFSSEDERENKENTVPATSSSSKSSSRSPSKSSLRASTGSINAHSCNSKSISSENLKQPTIRATMLKPRSPKQNAQEILYVSQEFYNKEFCKLEEQKIELSSAEKLLEKISGNLPDGGKQLRNRIESLRLDIDSKSKYVNSLKVHDGNISKPKPKPRASTERKTFFNSDAPNWDDLSAAVNQVQPKFTGDKGMAKFNAEKALTIDRLKDLHGSLKNCPDEHVLADDPKGLRVQLMDHQKHALAWMNWREQQKPRGGILADDMGLGKTLTMISLVLANKIKENGTDSKNDDDSHDSETDESNKSKWSSKGRRDSYNGGTLVVCPASLMRQWENEVETKLLRNKLTICVHHGNNRDTKPRHLRTYDMVVTTYNIVMREHKTSSALFGIRWRRIILDEAHVVRNHKAQSSLAVCGLKGKYRWALTGTPIQNKEMDIYALMKYLRCSPFDDLAHWKKWIDNKSAGGQQRLNMLMKSIMLRRTKCQLQEIGKLDALPNKEVRLIEVILDKEEMNVYQKIMTYSRSLFAQFLYQRAERDTDNMYREQGNRPTFMQTKDPNGAYYKMHKKVSKMYHGGKEVKSHEILTLLLRLRQICCHPGLIDSMLEDEDAKNYRDGSDEETPELDLLAQLNKLTIKDNSRSSRNSSRETDLEDSLRPEDERIAKASARVLQRSNPVFDLKRPSTKMLKVLEILKKIVLKTNDKAIIVSQWTSVLDLLKVHLQKENIKTLSLDGSVQVKFRQGIVHEFNDPNSSKRVLLLSLTAGGVGLNLVGANHLLLIDLHWNPQLEAQAQDRIYRVGQKKNVIIYKFMCLDTVEQRIKALQDHKLELANGVLTGVNVGAKLTIDDLKSLFGL